MVGTASSESIAAHSIEYLRERLRYDPETGKIFSRVSHARWKAGDEIGYVTELGYIRLSVGRRRYLAHRLVFALMTGSWPASEIDHINQNKTDNRWSNLREITRIDNMQNITWAGDGHVSHNLSKPYRAQCMVRGVRYHLGYFATQEEARRAYHEAKKSLI